MADTSSIRERILARGSPGYELARRACMWNARVPERYPDVIVQARDVYDVVAAVRYARQRGLRVGVRSGGHSWAGNHVRDGGMLLDVSRLDTVTVDRDGLRATTGPGRAGNELSAMLARAGLFFPTGHCKGVCVGGYLLQGGFGWHSRVLGLACESVLALDVVTAQGEVLHCSPTENADLYWSARGSGPGFFGVVTRFHLKVYPRPRVIGFAVQNFPLDRAEEVYRWAHAVGPEVPDTVEMQLLTARHTPGLRGAGVSVFAPVFADTWGEATRAVRFLTHGPLASRAGLRIPFVPTGVGAMYSMVMTHYPADHRWAVDNLWTHASAGDLVPRVKAIADSLPPRPAHMLWLNWAPGATRQDMAFSLEDKVYIALYGAWKHAADDHRYEHWATDHVRGMKDLSTGCQLADENLGRHPQRFVSDSALSRLDTVRARYDPDGRFHPWMGRP